MADLNQLERVVWSVAGGWASDDDVALLHADHVVSLRAIDRLIIETEDDLASVRSLSGDERDQVVADLAETLDSLRSTAARLRPPAPCARTRALAARRRARAAAGRARHRDEVQLQASWSGAGRRVGGGRGARPESHDELPTRLEAIGGPPVGWQLHPGVQLPGGHARRRPRDPGEGRAGLARRGGRWPRSPAGVGASVLWLGHVALEGVRLAACGSIVPALRVARRAANGRPVDAAVRWRPALVDSPAIDALAAAMPGTVAASGAHGSAGVRRATVLAVITAVVEAIVAESVERMELPAAPPSANSAVDLADAVIARMDGSPFRARAALASDLSRRLEHWTRTVTDPTRPRLVVQLDAPGPGGVWLVSVLAPSGKGGLSRIDAALRAERGSRVVTAEWQRLGRPLPALNAPRVAARVARSR